MWTRRGDLKAGDRPDERLPTPFGTNIRPTALAGTGPGSALWVCVLAVLLTILVGCGKAPSQEAPGASWIEASDPGSLVWPDPPSRARIKFLTAINSPEEVKFRKSWVRRALDWVIGGGEHRFVRPYGIAARDTEALVVTDPGSGSIHVFDFKSQRYRNISLNDEQGGFSSPVGVAIDNNGLLYVVDSDRAAVFVLTLEGKLVRTIGANGELERPAGLAIHPENGFLYVVDVLKHRVVVYDSQGQRRFQFGSRGVEKGKLNYPTHIFIDKNDEIWITDSMNFRVQAFAPDGTFLLAVGKAGDGAGNFSKPKGVAVDGDGHIYVVDALFDSVQILDREGTPLMAFGASGQGEGEFWLPSGIWIDERDRIYVADSYNQRIQVFQYVR